MISSRGIPNPGLSRYPDFREAWSIYTSSFPADERRNFCKQLEVLRDKQYSFRPLRDAEGSVTALLARWDFGSFIFIEHLAVDSKHRGKGLGSEIMKQFLAGKGQVILECEPPELSREAEARIKFYERLGFKVNNFDYIQPPYSAGKKPLPMRILSYPEKLSPAEYEKIRDTLYDKVYRVADSAALTGASFSGPAKA